MDPSPGTVTIAALTYRRPDDLAEALPRLLRQADDVPGTTVLIVDNDPAGSAEPVLTAAAEADPRVRHVHEPIPGIAAARNRALDEAGTDLLVFIDDDERPVDGWLTALLDEFGRHPGCLGVVGPVTSDFTVEPDPWIVAGGFFERRRLDSGTPVELVATNNLLLDLRLLRALGVRFDQSFGLTGGSDTKFSLDAGAAGGRFHWCAPALVHDVVPPERLTRQWVLRRAYRYGNSWSATRLATLTGRGERLRAGVVLVAQGAARLAAGTGVHLIGRMSGSIRHQARGARTAARGRGMIAGVTGRLYVEYRRTPDEQQTQR